jgi:hypothetical protein
MQSHVYPVAIEYDLSGDFHALFFVNRDGTASMSCCNPEAADYVGPP